MNPLCLFIFGWAAQWVSECFLSYSIMLYNKAAVYFIYLSLLWHYCHISIIQTDHSPEALSNRCQFWFAYIETVSQQFHRKVHTSINFTYFTYLATPHKSPDWLFFLNSSFRNKGIYPIDANLKQSQIVKI